MESGAHEMKDKRNKGNKGDMRHKGDKRHKRRQKSIEWNTAHIGTQNPRCHRNISLQQKYYNDQLLLQLHNQEFPCNNP